MDFSETIVVYDVKVGKCSKLNEYMNVYEYQMSRSLAFIQGHSDSTFSNFFRSETAKPIEAKFHMEASWDVGNKNLFKCSRSHNRHMPIYGEKLQKSSSLEQRG